MSKRVAHKGKGFFGETIYYDENYNEIGRTATGFIGYDVYDKDLNKVGHATDNFWGGKDYYDKEYNKIGSENRAPLMGHNQYDVNHNRIGHSGPNMFGGESLRGGHPVNNLLNDQQSEEKITVPEYRKSKDLSPEEVEKIIKTIPLFIPDEEKTFDERHPILFPFLFLMFVLFLFFLLGVVR